MTIQTYAAPTMREYGSVGELTGIGGGSAQTDVFVNLTGFTINVGGETIGPGQSVSGTGSIEGCVQPIEGPCEIPNGA